MMNISPELAVIFSHPIEFGLRRQGHIPVIEKLLSEGRSWEEIGRAIHWCPETAKEHYERFCNKEG